MARGQDFAELQAWFLQQLQQRDIDWQRLPLQMDGQSPFDFQCQQLLHDAEHHWRLKYGFAPSAKSLMTALFAAVSEQDQRPPTPWWQRWIPGRKGA